MKPAADEIRENSPVDCSITSGESLRVDQKKSTLRRAFFNEIHLRADEILHSNMISSLSSDDIAAAMGGFYFIETVWFRFHQRLCL